MDELDPLLSSQILLPLGAQVVVGQSVYLSRVEVLKLNHQDVRLRLLVSPHHLPEVIGPRDVQSQMRIDPHPVDVSEVGHSEHVLQLRSIRKEAHPLVPTMPQSYFCPNDQFVPSEEVKHWLE